MCWMLHLLVSLSHWTDEDVIRDKESESWSNFAKAAKDQLKLELILNPGHWAPEPDLNFYTLLPLKNEV